MLASIKTQPTSANQGGRSAPVHSFDLMVAPLDSVDPSMAERFALETPLHYRQTFAHVLVEIRSGWYLVIGNREYPIKGVASWNDEDNSGYIFYQLIVEDLRAR